MGLARSGGRQAGIGGRAQASAHLPLNKVLKAAAQQRRVMFTSPTWTPSMWSAQVKLSLRCGPLMSSQSSALPSYRHPANPLDRVRVKVLAEGGGADPP
eukprot:7379416-Prymnesium_polylepis.2